MNRPNADLTVKLFNSGEVIFHQGDLSKGEAYLVHSGAVEVRRRLEGQDRVLRRLVEGDLLGEVALFRDGPHTATAVAVGTVALLVIPANRLESLIRKTPQLAIALIRQLARMAADSR